MKGARRKKGREEEDLTIDTSSTMQGGHLSLARKLPPSSQSSCNSACMIARTIYFAPPTFKLAPPIFWPNLAHSALAPPTLSGVQRLDLSLVQQKVSVSRNREVSAAGRLHNALWLWQSELVQL